MRIAYCLPQLTGGADLLQQMRIADGLRARGHDLTFVAPRDQINTICTKDLREQRLAPLTWSRSAWFSLASKLAWRGQQALGVPYLNVFSNYSLYDACLQCLPGHDLVQERNGLYKMGVAMACKRLKLPYVLFFDADDLFELDFLGEPVTGLLRKRAAQIIRYTLSAADGIVTVSEATRRRLVEVWRVAGEKIAVFPNGVDVDEYRPYPEKRAEVRASLGLGEEPVILYVGSFYLWHDVGTLIEAFSRVLRAHPEARLLLVGDGKLQPEMKRRAEALGVGGCVQFTGRLPHAEIPALVSAADMAVAPYPKMEQAWWGSSMKLFEYMASGVALVASNVGEQVTEVVRHEENGLLAAPGEAADLAGALVRLIEDPALRSRLSGQARKDAVNQYSWDRYLQRLERLHQAAIRREPIHSI